MHKSIELAISRFEGNDITGIVVRYDHGKCLAKTKVNLFAGTGRFAGGKSHLSQTNEQIFGIGQFRWHGEGGQS